MLNLSHLRYFADAARAGSLAEAARINRVSQSAVSQAVRALERQFNEPLLTHRKRRFALTEAGARLLAGASAVFASVESLHFAVDARTARAFEGPLAIAGTHSLATEVLVSRIATLRRDHPGVRLTLQVGNSDTIRDWVARGEAELGFLLDDGKDAAGFGQTTIAEGEYRLFRAAATRAADLRQGIIVTRESRPEAQYFLRNLRLPRNPRGPRETTVPVPVRAEIVSWEVIQRMVLHTGGYGICPDYVIAGACARGELRAVRPPFRNPRYRMLALWSAARPPGRNARRFLELMEARDGAP